MMQKMQPTMRRGLATRAALRTALAAACGAHTRPTPTYAGAPTIRPLDAQLEDSTWVAKQEAEAAAVMLVDLNSNSVAANMAGNIAWVSPSVAKQMGGEERVLLGRRKHLPPSFLNPRYSKVAADTWCFAAAVSGQPEAPSAAGYVGLREIIDTCTGAEAAMASQARNLLLWHRSSRFCGVCSTRTEFAKAGWKRRCPGCGAQHFPRTDPVVIAAVLSPDGQRCLVGRQRKWPKGRFSCLAGFVDPGESLEDAVRREVKEEAGCTIGDDVFYYASQPWPNGPGGQLMLGFLAVAESESLTVDTDELEAAQWVSIREELTAALQCSQGAESGLRVPPPSAIAHTLLSAACEAHRNL